MTPLLEYDLVQDTLHKHGYGDHSASDLGFALEALSLSSSSGADRTGMATAPGSSAWSKSNGLRERIWMIVAGVMALALLAFGVAYFRRPAPEGETLRLFVTPPEKATRFDLPTISPDGRTLAFVATVEGKTQLWAQPLNSAKAIPLAEIGAIEPPFWSPDSRFICFIEGNSLKKIALAGGAPETLCDSAVPLSVGSWNREGAYLASLDGGEPKFLLPLDNPVVGVAANPGAGNEGYMVFRRQGSLLAQSFDFSRKRLVGEPLRLAQQVKIATRVRLMTNYVQASLSVNGALVLIEGNATDQATWGNENQQLTWFDRAGKKLGTVGRAGAYAIPRLSPDGKRLAVARMDSTPVNSDIYLFDLAGGIRNGGAMAENCTTYRWTTG